MKLRSSNVSRQTRETRIDVALELDGERKVVVATGIGFFDHMLSSLAFHAGWNLELSCTGDLNVDDHHTVEDCALVLGRALDEAAGDRSGIARFSSAYAPLDEALARSVIDFSGRPSSVVDLKLERPSIGQLATENLTHFFGSLATGAGMTIHVDVLRGENDHHRAEAAFKATALALRGALAPASNYGIPSTKGILKTR